MLRVFYVNSEGVLNIKVFDTIRELVSVIGEQYFDSLNDWIHRANDRDLIRLSNTMVVEFIVV